MQYRKVKSKGKREHQYFYSSLLFLVLAIAMSTLLDEVLLHRGHPLCNKCWIQCVYKSSL